MIFFAYIDKAYLVFTKFCKKVQDEKWVTIACVRSDYGKEFEDHFFVIFCYQHGINHNFLVLKLSKKWGR